MPVIDSLYRLPRAIKPVEIMIANYERLLNPKAYPLTDEAKKRLKWMYVVEYETPGKKIATAARSLSLSRQWLSVLHNTWKKSEFNPKALEPRSKAPHRTTNRKRIPQGTQDKIIALRKLYPCWGKEKLARKMRTKHGIIVGHNTVNRYLADAKLLNVRISQKNKGAWADKHVKQKQKVRPPKGIKDYKPGALVEKDMKLVPKLDKPNKIVDRAKENFYYQHTEIDSFTRLRVLELVKDSTSLTARDAHKRAIRRLPFAIACQNTDNGGENEKDFAEELRKNGVVHFYSRSATPTDNPRVERSHLTDELEFYQQGGIKRTFKEQEQEIQRIERVYNFERPHQALGYLTPMEFYQLWKASPESAHKIASKWQAYLKKQAKRQAISRRMKKKEEVEALMQHIDSVLTLNSYH